MQTPHHTDSDITSVRGPTFPVAQPEGATAVLVLEDGEIIWGYGFGKFGTCVGEICFNTGMTGYQEALTDTSYAGQILAFTFPHIGNVGANPDDFESKTPSCLGLIISQEPTGASNFRATESFTDWVKTQGLRGIWGIDVRKLTRRLRDGGAVNAALCVIDPEDQTSQFDVEGLKTQVEAWPGLEGMDLAKEVTVNTVAPWGAQGLWRHGTGYDNLDAIAGAQEEGSNTLPLVVAIDFGAKSNIMRALASSGCHVQVVPANISAADILALKPDGIFLSNGPGDPAATGVYAVETLKTLIDEGLPIFGICLGHQILALALGGETEKMHHGHHGANHPVQVLGSGAVEITSQNHGFQIRENSLPPDIEITHRSLFDGSIEGLKVKGRPIFSVQHHPEASPGPTDSAHMFAQFIDLIHAHRSRSK